MKSKGVRQIKEQQVLKLLSKNIKKGRVKLDLSQESLADLSCLDRTYISQIERALANPSLSSCVAIAIALEIPFLELFRD